MISLSPTHLIYESSKEKLQFDGQGVCALCSDKKYKVEPQKNYIGDNFNNRDLLRGNTGFICEACATTLKNSKIRRSCWVIDAEKQIFLSKQELEPIIFDLYNCIGLPFIFAVTTSYKKHLFLHCEANYNHNKFKVRFDDVTVTVNAEKHQGLFSNLCDLYNHFTKTEIKNADYNFKKIRDYGMHKWEEMESQISGYRGSPIFDFLLYILNKTEKV